jgi:hypothetical protein
MRPMAIWAAIRESSGIHTSREYFGITAPRDGAMRISECHCDLIQIFSEVGPSAYPEISRDRICMHSYYSRKTFFMTQVLHECFIFC